MPKKSAKKAPAAKKTPAANKAPAVEPVTVTAEVQGSAEAAAEFLSEAQQIPIREIRPLRADPALLHHNISAGLEATKPHEAELAKLPAPFDLGAMKSLRRLALGLVYVAAQVDRSSPGTTATLLKRAHEVRDVLLSAAVALMKSGILPAQKVKKILAGRGTRDAVQDCVDLAQLFRDNAPAIKGKTAVTKEQMDEAASVGNQLLAILKPKGAKTTAPEAVKSAVDARDRLWTLLSRRHAEQLRRAGMWLWGDDVDEHVPPLLARTARKPRKAKDSGADEGNAPNGG